MANNEILLVPAQRHAQGLSAADRNRSSSALTPRELEILRLVSKGAGNKMIALECRISETTVKAHLLRIRGKLDVLNRTQAVAAAIEKGLID